MPTVTRAQRRTQYVDTRARRAAVARRIAAHLAQHGPRWGADVAEALGLSLEVFWDAVHGFQGNPYFRLVGGGWGLTERGRAEGAA